MVFHWPQGGQLHALADSMREMRGQMLAMPGCLEVAPPYVVDEDGECLVGISTWESREAFEAAGIPLRPPDEVVEGETRPRRRFFLDEVVPS